MHLDVGHVPARARSFNVGSYCDISVHPVPFRLADMV